jgi:hypothetical protein
MDREDYCEELRRKTEHVAGFRMQTKQDFSKLAMCIFKDTREMISDSTLRRFFGYQKEKVQTVPSQHTLDLLAQYVGYIDFETFCKYLSHEGNSCSDFLLNNCLQAKSLLKGDKVKLFWEPDRCVTVQYIGLCMFKVLASRNSKLSVDDVFICERIVENQPLMLSNLIHENGDPVNYICGKKGGVKFQTIAK